MMGVIVNMQKKLFDFFNYVVIKKSYITVCGISIIGLFCSFYYELTMDKDAWFWFFSTLAQTFAALIALTAAFSIFHLDSYNVQIHSKFDYLRIIIRDTVDDEASYFFVNSDKCLEKSFDNIRLTLDKCDIDLWDKITNEIFDIKQKKEKFKNDFKELFSSSLILVMYSLMLLPLGSMNSENDILYIWNFLNLKWFFIYLAVGYCLVVLCRLTLRLSEFFKEDE
jgi:hypothetical protein